MKSRFIALGSAALVLSQLLPAVSGLAASFSDVPSNHIYREQIETLTERGIIKGNPDQSYKPSKTINRAEMLTILYRAAGKTGTTPSKACFKDVERGGWYEGVVCDAVKNGYVGGYPDGNFRPGQDVNRVEAIKMIHTVFGLNVGNASTDPLKKYGDLVSGAWYMPYMASAFSKNILPIAEQDGSKFYPDRALTRGEAAAYIFNALGLKLTGDAAEESSSSAQGRSSRSTQSEAQDTTQLISVDFPFGDDGSFTEKKTKVYSFNVQKPTVAEFKVRVDNGNAVQCRLFKIEDETSFALEYYLGHVVDSVCSMRVALGNGEYQFEVMPRTANIYFDLTTKTVKGDGNDGFTEASLLVNGTPKTGNLEVEDFVEFYHFKLTKEQKLTVEAIGTANLRCIVYPMGDVDLYGFSGPICGEEYLFPEGTYYIGVQRLDGRTGKESFSIRFN